MESSNCASNSDASSSKKTYKCTVKGCSASFSKNNKLVYHIRKHTGERPFACDKPGCDKTYTNSSHLTRHKKVSHGVKDSQSVVCEYEGCGLILANKYSLKKHFNRKHKGNYPFVCTECTQGFHRKRQLKQHMYIHTGEVPYECDQCDQSFTTSYKLNKHKKFHRTYTCECGEKFERWSLILLHKKMCHHPRYTCEICKKTFDTLYNCKVHKLVHMDTSKKMIFTCPYPDCNRFYFYKKNIKYHIDYFHKKVHENKKYPCIYPNCTMELKTKQSLKSHLKKVHSKWVQKKHRKVRRDKGKPKKSMISILTGLEDPTENVDKTQNQLKIDEASVTGEPTDKIILKESNETLTIMENVDNNSESQSKIDKTSVTEELTDEIILKECDDTLAILENVHNTQSQSKINETSVTGELTDEVVLKETDESLAIVENVDNTENHAKIDEICVPREVTDEAILKECNDTLTIISEKLVAGS